MKKFKFIYFFMAIMLLFCVAKTDTYATGKVIETVAEGKISNLNWELSDSGLLTISGNGELVIDENPNLFSDYDVREIAIGEGVTSIGDYTFSNLQNLSTVTLASTVKYVGEGAFKSCINLSTVNISPSNSECTYDATAFDNTKWAYSQNGFVIINNVLIRYTGNKTEVVIPENVIEIGSRAFLDYVALEKVELPPSLTKIGDEAFLSCDKLKSVVIPKAVTDLGKNAFHDNTKMKSQGKADTENALKNFSISAIKYIFMIAVILILAKIIFSIHSSHKKRKKSDFSEVDLVVLEKTSKIDDFIYGEALKCEDDSGDDSEDDSEENLEDDLEEQEYNLSDYYEQDLLYYENLGNSYESFKEPINKYFNFRLEKWIRSILNWLLNDDYTDYDNTRRGVELYMHSEDLPEFNFNSHKKADDSLISTLSEMLGNPEDPYEFFKETFLIDTDFSVKLLAKAISNLSIADNKEAVEKMLFLILDRAYKKFLEFTRKGSGRDYISVYNILLKGIENKEEAPIQYVIDNFETICKEAEFADVVFCDVADTILEVIIKEYLIKNPTETEESVLEKLDEIMEND